LTFKKLDDNNYIFEGKTMINDMCKSMELSVDTFDMVKGEADSLAGLVLEIAGEIPKQSQVIECGDFEFRVLELVKYRIEKVKVTIKPMP
jgi:putative hemolysin